MLHLNLVIILEKLHHVQIYIKNKKIKKVVYGIHDVDKRTSKKAKKFFKKNNIQVINGILSKKINKFYKSYFYIKRKKLPYVIGKIASSKDGFIKSKKYRFITNSYHKIFLIY